MFLNVKDTMVSIVAMKPIISMFILEF